MMNRFQNYLPIFVFCLCVLLVMTGGAARAQEIGLVAQDMAVNVRRDAYGQDVQVIEGQLVNESARTYTNVSLFAEVYDADDELVGEGFGYLVNACGAALNPDFALQPEQMQRFAAALELFEDDVTIDRVEIIPQATEADVASADEAVFFNGIIPVTQQEVVAVEWIDAQSLRYGVGCVSDVFTALDWYEYDIPTGSLLEIEHPKAELITDALLQQLGLTDPNYFNRSHLTFAPDHRRLVYQNDLNAFITAEPDGSFKRVVYDDLFRHSLQGIVWQSQGRFLAYYFGAYGEPVRYFTASIEGQPISRSLYEAVPSVIVPAPSLDGTRAVVGGTYNDVTGYYLVSTVFENVELLFESELPGNNWPAPVYARRDPSTVFIYIARPVEGQSRLECYDLQTDTLNNLTPLPLDLGSDDRAWMWLSPDGNTLAVAANGPDGGLWLVNLPGFMTCQ